jgi:hypothetical protein
LWGQHAEDIEGLLSTPSSKAEHDGKTPSSNVDRQKSNSIHIKSYKRLAVTLHHFNMQSNIQIKKQRRIPFPKAKNSLFSGLQPEQTPEP